MITNLENKKLAAANGRFDKLFSLCEQEFRQKSHQPPQNSASAQTSQDADSFRLAAIQSLLKRPVF